MKTVHEAYSYIVFFRVIFSLLTTKLVLSNNFYLYFLGIGQQLITACADFSPSIVVFIVSPHPRQAQVLNCSTCDCDHVCDSSLCRFKDFGIRSISNDGQPYERRRFETQTQGRSHVETEAESYASQDTLRRVRCHQKLGERHGMSFQKGPSLFDFRLLISIFINCERKNFS